MELVSLYVWQYPKWIYPKWWHDGGGDEGLGTIFQNKVGDPPGYSSYSFKKGKTPERNHGISFDQNSTHYNEKYFLIFFTHG